MSDYQSIYNTMMKSIIYGIDLAQSLNYCGIVVLEVSDKVRIRTLRKFKDVMYPQIKQLLIRDMFPKIRPDAVGVDYSNEKSFSEELETVMNPQFNMPTSEGYTKWKYVRPIIFTNALKLEMKQNARNFLEHRWFEFPEKEMCHPAMWELIQELKDQMFREADDGTGRDGNLKFSKPEGHDNDLVMALEIALLVAKDYYSKYASAGGDNPPYIETMSLHDDPSYVSPTELAKRKVEPVLTRLREKMGMEINDIKVNLHDGL